MEPPIKCAVKVIGRSNSGKTSAIVSALKTLSKRGVKVGVVKHTHHNVDIRGKDTWRFLEEGGAQVSIIVKGGGERIAVFAADLSLGELLDWINSRVDAVILEGFKDLRIAAVVVNVEELGVERSARLIVESIMKCSGGSDG
ncbi:MAG: molybdopterin-guanine dinucleotide biosynthesis protein B [Aeropyrum sp.]|nr:molybdopterin-guanine dinucleotide biosynthesis protein B [Aeropyrum sp.]MCE4616335.1 molybdopterin-guanine dinucleotide biosynthesis protein B [Aeropyrum sp.]